ncbi:helix-turn-helix domain-containing protein [Peribacillus frigoritolerans]|uniref:helix-turn-helix domain-containing protein n=1 Tax=Peribacillus frigoritolerans TaxID=450367 RepID=UPI00227DEF96|nr:helix-turn-helix domain-containing protein [Peribacillus frigoritolerans]MCY9007165.1 helix-turn-helix domain-containing protein [Peribacillus frigoritolerans]
MRGLEFICKVFDIQYKEVAEKIGVSNQTITDWTRGKTTKIPEKRINDLVTKIPEFSRINRKLFSKELTSIDKQNITSIFLIYDLQRQLKEQLNNPNKEVIENNVEMAQAAQKGITTSINIESLILIADHLIENQKFMDELDELIVKHMPILKQFLK